MATDAIINLQRLDCIRETEEHAVLGHSEPYIWPALIWVDNNTLAGNSLVGITTPAQSYAREVIQYNMSAGQSAQVPPTVGVLRARLEDASPQMLVVVVVLLEADATPPNVVRTGFIRFSQELRTAARDFLPELANADTQEEVNAIIRTIATQVQSRVRSAIWNALDSYQKLAVILGNRNLDDILGYGYRVYRGELSGQPISLTIGDDLTRPRNRFTLSGQLQTTTVRFDRCQGMVRQVAEAQALVDSIEAGIDALRDQLHGEGDQGGPALPKAYLIEEIGRMTSEDLLPALAALQQARDALAACRSITQPRAESEGTLVSA